MISQENIQTETERESGLESSKLIEKVDSLNHLSRELCELHVEKALELSIEAGKLSDNVDYKKGKADAILNEALCLKKNKNYKGALEKAGQALSLYEFIENEDEIKVSTLIIGRLLLILGDHEKALEKFQNGLKISNNGKNLNHQACAHLHIGKIYFNQQKLEESHLHAKIAQQLGTEAMDKDVLYKSHQLLSDIFEQQNDPQSALHHYKLYHLLHQQVQEIKAESQKKELLREFEVEKANRETEIYRLKNIELAQAYEYLKYLNNSLNEANEFKSELLSIAAHDMKNPLQAIMSFSEMISMDNESNERVLKKSASIYNASQQLLKLINGLLETSAIECGKLHLQFTPVDLNVIFQLVLSNHQMKAEKKNQTISFDSSKSFIVNGDEDRLHEIFDNLLSNAIKYSPEHSSIWIKLYPGENNTVIVSIKDEGPGLTDEDKQNLFKKFQRLSAKPTKGEKSTGLGLWISKQLIELHHGKIWAKSDGSGRGSIFYVQLPLKK